MGKVKIGVFGAGRGKTMIGQVLNRPDGQAELVAICDKYRPALDEAGKMAKDKGLDVALYEDFDEFIQHDMDAVVLANYANQHAPYAIRVMKSGRHVMSECLTCATLKEAVELIEAVEETGKIYTYAENYCYFNTTFEMMVRYKKGDIGELMQAECEYLHDCSSIWPKITYGDRNHWRNHMSSVFYCTHSIGPILFSTGLRPVRVSGFETRNMDFMRKLGDPAGSAGTLILTLENGAIVKSIDMNLRRHGNNYILYGDRGVMETDRFNAKMLHIRQEREKNCTGDWVSYTPLFTDERASGAGHGGGDYFTTNYFIDRLLGNNEVPTIDVYQAVDMCIPGILGFRSIMNKNVGIDIPNLRNKAERDAFRNDTFCTFPEVAGDQYVPCNVMQANKDEIIEDAVYEEVRRKWLAHEQG